MPPMDPHRNARLNHLRELLMQGPASSQGEIAGSLRKAGFAATQSSVSRDLRDLGALKTSAGYVLPEQVRQAPPPKADLAILRSLVRGFEEAGPHLLVVKTGLGAASRVGLAIDRFAWPEVAGTVAGDDTLFVAVRNLKDRKRVERHLAGTLWP